MNLIDFFAMGGQERRRMLDDYVDGLNLERFLPPNLRPAGQFVNEMNPVNAMGNAMQDASVVFDPEQTNAARLAAARDMGMEMAMTLAPAALVRMGYLAAPAGLAETFALPVGVDQLATDALSDVKYAARSVADGDMQGLIDVLTPSGQPQSLSAAGVGDNGGPPLDAVPARASMFSPSLRAAENLKQNKGTYEQMRGMLLKGGAKDVELEWSGADRHFAGKKVTKDDLINYLRSNDVRLQETRLESYGRTGNDNYMDMDQLVDRYVESNLEAETEYYLNTYGPERLYDEYRPVTDLDEDELIDVAQYEGYDEDQLDEFLEDYKGYWISDQQELFSNEEAALADALGTGALDAEVAAESLARESLEENARYNMGEDELRELVAPDDLEDLFDPYETQYGDYFPAGATNYSENVYSFVPTEDTFPADRVAGASHFGEYDEGAQLHTRTGDFPVRGTDSRALYLGEIQSDAQQNINKPLLSYDEGVRLGELDQLTNSLTNQANRYAMNRSDHYVSLKEEMARLQTLERPEIKAMMQDLDNQAFLDTFNNDVGYSPRKDSVDIAMDKKLPALYSDLSADDFELLSKYKRAYVSDYGRGMSPAQLADAAINHTDLVPDNEVGEGLRGVLAKHAAAGNYRDAYTRTAAEQERYFLEDNPDFTSDKLEGIGGPMMGSQNKWVDYALKRTLIDAVNDPSVDYLALPKDERAIGAVGGSYSPKTGAINYYNRDVQNRFNNLLKSIDPDARTETIFLQSDGNNYIDDDFDAYALRLTPELRRRVKEQGLSTFAALGAMPALGFIEYMREKQENRNQQLGGLMGYGGL